MARTAPRWKPVFWSVTGLLLALLAGAFALPREVVLTRTVQIAAPPDRVREALLTFEDFDRWSPFWRELPDGSVRTQVRGAGPGQAEFTWDGDAGIGTGSVRLVAASANSVQWMMEYEGRSMPIEFALNPAPEGATTVNLSLRLDTGFNPLLRLLSLRFDAMFGSSWATALNDFRQRLEAKTAGQKAR